MSNLNDKHSYELHYKREEERKKILDEDNRKTSQVALSKIKEGYVLVIDYGKYVVGRYSKASLRDITEFRTGGRNGKLTEITKEEYNTYLKIKYEKSLLK